MIDTITGMIKKLTGNIGLKLVSLGLAFLLWLFVVSIENPVMNLSFTSIPITIENEDVMESQGKAFELADSSKTVTVTVKAERSVLSELSRDNIKAVVDMDDLEGNRVPIEVRSTRYADRIQSISPSKEFANVVIEDLASSQFRIQVETTGTVTDGYAVGTTSLQNNVVRVKGPESVVSAISEAVVRVNVSGMTSEIHTVVPVLLLDENGDQVDTTSLEVSVDQASVSVDIWRVEEINISASSSGIPAAGYAATGVVTASPASVFVTGDSSALAGLNTVTIPGSELDITNAMGNVAAEVNISSYLPAGVYIDTARNDGLVTITAEVEEAAATVLQIPYSNLAVTGLPDNMVIGNDMTASTVAVTVRGLKARLDVLNAAEITGTLDLSGIALNENGGVTPGSYAGEVTLLLPDGISQDTAVAHVLLQMKEDTASDEDENAGDRTGEAGESDNGERNNE